VTVAGKVKGDAWYMISQGGAGSGFVSTNLLTRAPTCCCGERTGGALGGGREKNGRGCVTTDNVAA
jgi:hypothetical protein